MKETYFGDGLYASHANGIIELRAPRPDGDHKIYLESEVFASLLAWAKAQGFLK